jgi:dynein heavy chain
MQDTIRDIIRTACQQVANMTVPQLRDFVKSYTPQVALLGVQAMWTQKITEGLERTAKNEKGAMEQKRKEIQQMMELFTSMCLENLSSSIIRQSIETIVTVHVHHRDIAVELKCKDVGDFDWQKQTRIYWKQEQDNCVISITDWDCVYSYEFLGAKERLCITALTDRCYITLA